MRETGGPKDPVGSRSRHGGGKSGPRTRQRSEGGGRHGPRNDRPFTSPQRGGWGGAQSVPLRQRGGRFPARREGGPVLASDSNPWEQEQRIKQVRMELEMFQRFKYEHMRALEHNEARVLSMARQFGIGCF